MKLVIVASAGLLIAGCQTLGLETAHEMGERLNGRPMEVGQWPSTPTPREFAYAKIAESDRRCENYLVALSAGDNAIAGALDVAGLGASLLGAGTSSLSNANNLARGTGFLQGLRSATSNTLFGGQEFALIYDTVHAGRKAERAALKAGIDDGQFDGWTLDGVLAVINAYDVQCGINYAAQIIRQQMARSSTPPPPSVLTPGPAPAPGPDPDLSPADPT